MADIGAFGGVGIVVVFPGRGLRRQPFWNHNRQTMINASRTM